MKNIADIKTLEQARKDNSGGYKMPEFYLENFDTKMYDKIVEENANSVKAARLSHRITIGFAVAAMLFISMFLWFPKDYISNNTFQNNYWEMELDQYAMLEEAWISEEFQSLNETDDVELDAQLDFLIQDEDIQMDEIIEVMLNE